MSLTGMASLVAGLAGGFQQGQRQARDEKRQDDADARTKWQFEQQQKQAAKQDEQDAAIKAAAEPVQPTEVDVPQPIAGEAGALEPANPTVKQYRVGGKNYATGMEALSASRAADEADPSAVLTRQAAALSRTNPAAGAQMQHAALQMTQMRRKDAADSFSQGLAQAAAGGWEGLTGFLSKSTSTDTQVKPIISADGKSVTIHKVAADGTDTAMPFSFANSAEGLAQAQMMLNQGVPIEAKLKHYQAERELAGKETYQNGMVKIGQQNADTAALGEKSKAKYYDTRSDIESRLAAVKENPPAKASPYERMPEQAKLQLDALNKRGNAIAEAITRSMADQSWKEDSDGAKSLRKEASSIEMQSGALMQQYGLARPQVDVLGLRSGGGQSTGQTTTTNPPAAPVVDKKPPPPAPPPAVPATPLDQAGAALDKAKARLATATAALQTFGVRQRAANPEKFKAAQAEVEAAKEAAAQSYAAYQSAAPTGMSAAIRYSNP